MTKCQYVCLSKLHIQRKKKEKIQVKGKSFKTNIFCLFTIGSNFLIIRNESKIRPYLANYNTYMYCPPPPAPFQSTLICQTL